MKPTQPSTNKKKKEVEMRTKREAVQEIHDTATTAHVQIAAERALRDGSDRALNRALVEAKTSGQTLHVINVANEQLGYEPNDTSR
jgi:hypothetical protein